jgi:hypothetical protein
VSAITFWQRLWSFVLGSIINLKFLQSMFWNTLRCFAFGMHTCHSLDPVSQTFLAFHTHVFLKCVYATSTACREYGSCWHHLSVRHPQVRVFLGSNHLEQILQVLGYLRYQISRPAGNRPVFYSLRAFCLPRNPPKAKQQPTTNNIYKGSPFLPPASFGRIKIGQWAPWSTGFSVRIVVPDI